MTTVVDTSFVIALYDKNEPDHDQAANWVQATTDDLVTSPLAVAEMDYLVARGGGDQAAERLWRDLERGAFAVRWWAGALEQTISVARRLPRLGLTDASLVALAARVATSRVATFDHRHFRSATTVGGGRLTVLPADQT